MYLLACRLRVVVRIFGAGHGICVFCVFGVVVEMEVSCIVGIVVEHRSAYVLCRCCSVLARRRFFLFALDFRLWGLWCGKR